MRVFFYQYRKYLIGKYITWLFFIFLFYTFDYWANVLLRGGDKTFSLFVEAMYGKCLNGGIMLGTAALFAVVERLMGLKTESSWVDLVTVAIPLYYILKWAHIEFVEKWVNQMYVFLSTLDITIFKIAYVISFILAIIYTILLGKRNINNVPIHHT